MRGRAGYRNPVCLDGRACVRRGLQHADDEGHLPQQLGHAAAAAMACSGGSHGMQRRQPWHACPNGVMGFTEGAGSVGANGGRSRAGSERRRCDGGRRGGRSAAETEAMRAEASGGGSPGEERGGKGRKGRHQPEGMEVQAEAKGRLDGGSAAERTQQAHDALQVGDG